MAESHRDLCSEELSLVFRESLDRDQVAEQFTTFDEFHKEVDAELILKHIFHVDQKRVRDLVQDVLLELNVLHLLVFKDNVFADALHGVQLLVKLVLDHENLAKSALADQLPELKVGQLRLSLVA
jgi:hypothetical protein